MTESSDPVAHIRPFFEPQSVAVIGASPVTGDESFNVVDNLAQTGYRGKIYPVNPKYSEILGLKCYADVTEIPGKVDLAVIVTSRKRVLPIIEQCTRKEIKAVIVIAGGFADAGDDEGKRLQREMVEIARRGGVRILGPNTVGSANAFIDFSTSFVKQTGIRELPVGLVCQSGLFFGTIGRLRLLGKGLDIGNACDVDVIEGLEYFEQDEQVKVIVLHIEGVRDGRRFRNVARRVARKKPVLVLKTGRNVLAARAARSHTGSLVGRDEVWDAVFKQCGIIRVDNLDELGDLVRAFTYLPLMKGRGMGVLTAMGSVGVMSMDFCAEYGLEMAELSASVRGRIEGMPPEWFKAGNPLDIWPILMTSSRPLGENLRALLSAVMSEPAVNGIFLVAGAWFERLSPPITEVLMETADAFPDKPIAWCPYEGWLREIRAEDLSDMLEQAGKAAVFTSPHGALKALAKLAEYYEFLHYNG